MASAETVNLARRGQAYYDEHLRVDLQKTHLGMFASCPRCALGTRSGTWLPGWCSGAGWYVGRPSRLRVEAFVEASNDSQEIGNPDVAVTGTKRHAGNKRFARHLRKHRVELFVFLTQPGVIEATNHRAEQALWPAVVNRKVWGGNRTCRGAWMQGILNPVLHTSWQRGLHALTWLQAALCSTTPALLPSR